MSILYMDKANSVEVQCRLCKQIYAVPVTAKQLMLWKSGTLIQKAMPELTPAQRELLMTAICGSCFDSLFSDD